MGGRVSRRELLRNSGATIGTLAMAGAAGCLDELPGLSDSHPEYTRWMPARRDDVDYPHFVFRLARIPDWLEHEENLDYFDYKPSDEYAGPAITWGDLNLRITVGNPSAQVTTGDFDRSDYVEYALDAKGYSRAGTYNGFAVLEKETDQHTYKTAVRDGIRIYSPHHFRRTVDVAVGDDEGYISSDQNLADLTEKLDKSSNLWAFSRLDPLKINQAKRVAKGQTATFSEPPWEFRRVLLFESANTFGAHGIEHYFEEHKPWDFVTIDSVTKNGRAAIIEGTRNDVPHSPDI